MLLAIETSCDETAMALLECKGGLRRPQFKILAEVVSSQIPIHRPFGGVVPNLAKREHIKNLPIVYRKIFHQLNYLRDREDSLVDKKDKPDLLAVTVGPGLEPALWAGITFAQELGKKLKVPVIGANHLEGHIYSNWLPANSPKDFNNSAIAELLKIKFPAVCLIVSGGHTILLLMKSLTKWEILGETRDDAVGEAFDKVARMLNLPYPGGPEVEKLAKSYKLKTKSLINFPRPMIHDNNYEFSFSGLKTAVLYYLRDNFNMRTSDIPKIKRNAWISDVQKICASFQKAAIDVLTHKTMKAVGEFKAKSVLLCGGVACNKALQKEFRTKIKILSPRSYTLNPKFFVPDKKFNTDNAVMIAAAAYINYLKKKKYPLEAQGNLCI